MVCSFTSFGMETLMISNYFSHETMPHIDGRMSFLIRNETPLLKIFPLIMAPLPDSFLFWTVLKVSLASDVRCVPFQTAEIMFFMFSCSTGLLTILKRIVARIDTYILCAICLAGNQNDDSVNIISFVVRIRHRADSCVWFESLN